MSYSPFGCWNSSHRSNKGLIWTIFNPAVDYTEDSTSNIMETIYMHLWLIGWHSVVSLWSLQFFILSRPTFRAWRDGGRIDDLGGTRPKGLDSWCRQQPGTPSPGFRHGFWLTLPLPNVHVATGPTRATGFVLVDFHETCLGRLGWLVELACLSGGHQKQS